VGDGTSSQSLCVPVATCGQGERRRAGCIRGWPCRRWVLSLLYMYVTDTHHVVAACLLGAAAGARTSGQPLLSMRLAAGGISSGVCIFFFLDFTVVCVAPTGSVFDLARRQAPEHYIRVAGHWWWGASGSGLDLDRALGSQI
jgi:hypothetical protein